MCAHAIDILYHEGDCGVWGEACGGWDCLAQPQGCGLCKGVDEVLVVGEKGEDSGTLGEGFQHSVEPRAVVRQQ